MRGDYTVRAAVVEDIDSLTSLAAACEQAPRWSDGVWQGLLAAAGEVTRHCDIAEVDGNVVGFVVASFIAETAEIESVAVLPGFRRAGIGRALCLEAMRWARDLGAESVALEVRASSGGAAALYGALGFVVQGRRTAYYRDPVDDAVLMRATLAD